MRANILLYVMDTGTIPCPWEVTDDSYMKQIYESGITKMIFKRDSSLILVYEKHLFSIDRGNDKLSNDL